jgi:DNA-binding MarR family transcriptional regulator
MSEISEVATNVHRLSTVLGRIGDRVLQDNCGFGISQFKILWMLRTHEKGVLQTTIASWLSQTEAAVSRQIGLLSEENLIEKHVDPLNRRNHVILLSTEGKKFAEGAMKKLVAEYEPYFNVLTEEEQQTLNVLLEKVFYAVVGNKKQSNER